MLLLRHFPYLKCIRFCTNEAFRKTTAIFMNEALGAPLMIDSYSSIGFTLNNGMKILGSLVIFPKSVLGWNIHSAEQINEDSLSLFYMIEPKLDIVIIGVGEKGTKIDTNIYFHLKKKGLNVEILPTRQACTTYNFLATEGRFVAAALIPPDLKPPPSPPPPEWEDDDDLKDS